MSDEVMKGAFETTSSNMQTILGTTSAPVDTDVYGKAWMNLADGKLRAIANAGEALASFCEYSEPFVQDIELGKDVDPEAGMEAVVMVPQLQEYLTFVGGERVRIEFWGTESSRGASKMVIDGDLRAEIFLPNSESDFNSFLLGIPSKFDEWLSQDGLSTTFETTVEQIQRIVNAERFDHLALVNYPIVVKDGEFRLDASDGNDRDSISGSLWSQDVEGPDVDNSYTRGFEELAKGVSGTIRVYTEQDSVACFVRESNDGSMTLRYAILPAA